MHTKKNITGPNNPTPGINYYRPPQQFISSNANNKTFTAMLSSSKSPINPINQGDNSNISNQSLNFINPNKNNGFGRYSWIKILWSLLSYFRLFKKLKKNKLILIIFLKNNFIIESFFYFNFEYKNITLMNYDEYESEFYDHSLDPFTNYEEYLDSHITKEDLMYLGDIELARQLK